MADVFISYTKRDRAIAVSLAATLEAHGLVVWWDEAMYAGDDVHDRVRAEIANAQAVVVIWSESAAASRWVRGEASEAADLGTLISTHVPGFDPRHIPLDFRPLHCEPVGNVKEVIRSIERKRAGRRGIVPPPNPQTGSSAPNRISDPDPRVALGRKYEKGADGLPLNLRTAVELYTAAADLGDAWGLYHLARMYAEGLGGLPKDTAMAVRLFRRSAIMGNWAAPIVLMLRGTA